MTDYTVTPRLPYRHFTQYESSFLTSSLVWVPLDAATLDLAVKIPGPAVVTIDITCKITNQLGESTQFGLRLPNDQVLEYAPTPRIDLNVAQPYHCTWRFVADDGPQEYVPVWRVSGGHTFAIQFTFGVYAADPADLQSEKAGQ